MQQNHTGKYRALFQWLKSNSERGARLSFSQVEDILGFELPPSSRNHTSHWYSYGGSAVGRAIRDAGWRASLVNLTSETVVLERRTGSVGDEVATMLADREIDNRISGLLLAFAETSTVEVCTADTQLLPLAASHDAYAAVYVGKSDLSIALDPFRAVKVTEQHGFRLEPKSDATSFVHVKPGDLDSEVVAQAVIEILRESFDRSFHGPRWNRGLADKRISRGAVCPRCHMEMPLSGVCPNCS